MSAEGLLQLDGVSMTYPRGARTIAVLDRVSLAVSPGDLIAVHGKRNAGKSTLLAIAAGNKRPDMGTVRYAGHDLSSVSARRLAEIHREHLAFVKRGGPDGDELKMLDYVALGPLYRFKRSAARERARQTLERLGVLDCADARWEDLGAQERILVGLAHALVREPKLLLLDDPTGGLDAVERSRMLDLLRSLTTQAGVGILMAVPDMTSMTKATEMLILMNGHLIRADDSPDGDRGSVVDFPGSSFRRSA